MSDKNLMIIGGQASGTSTLIGGLVHYLNKEEPYVVYYTLQGAETEFSENVMDKMGQLEYPNQNPDHYILDLMIGSDSFVFPDVEVSILDFPGEGYSRLFGVNDLEQILDESNIDGNIGERYSNIVQEEFEHGVFPVAVDDIEIAIKYHYIQTDKIIFPLNFVKLYDFDGMEIIFNVDMIDIASQYTDVAVVPIGIDWVGYEIESNNNGILRQMRERVFRTGIRDEYCLEYLDNMNTGINNTVTNILHYIEANEDIDFIPVVVPDKGSPSERTGELTPDDSGGFVVEGFEDLVKWLRR
ncbi:MAG: hypothetical protein ABEI86_08940 [Halobacteriaceae archaeon]